MTTAVFALAAAAAALLIVGLVWVGVRSRTRAPFGGTADATPSSELGSRMDGLARNMTAALARVEEISRRQQALDDLGSSIDLDDVLDAGRRSGRVLPGADASVVHATAHDGSVSSRRSASPRDRGGRTRLRPARRRHAARGRGLVPL